MADAEEDRDDIDTDDDWLHVVLGVDIWLQGKNDPFFAQMRVRFQEDDKPETLEELTDCYANLIMHQMNSVQSHWLTLEDERENRYIVYFSQIQAVKVIAPEKMPAILTKEEDDE